MKRSRFSGPNSLIALGLTTAAISGGVGIKNEIQASHAGHDATIAEQKDHLTESIADTDRAIDHHIKVMEAAPIIMGGSVLMLLGIAGKLSGLENRRIIVRQPSSKPTPHSK